jgi:hypothetical protein
MTQNNDTCPGAGRTAARSTRVRVSSDAVVSGYIHDIARPHAGALTWFRHSSREVPESQVLADNPRARRCST